MFLVLVLMPVLVLVLGLVLGLILAPVLVPPPPLCACTALSKHGVGVEPLF